MTDFAVGEKVQMGKRFGVIHAFCVGGIEAVVRFGENTFQRVPLILLQPINE